MGEIKDGGPAFPLEYDGYNQDKFSNPGMTLRDYFAAKVVVGIMRTCDEIHDTVVNRDDIAMEAYRMADAMLKAREGK
jgi:hypothetical protein